jgi:hypothetical protein
MRCTIRYQNKDKNWILTDNSTGKNVMRIHSSKASAYKQAFKAKQTLQKRDLIPDHSAKIRNIIPQTLVLPFARNF